MQKYIDDIKEFKVSIEGLDPKTPTTLFNPTVNDITKLISDLPGMFHGFVLSLHIQFGSTSYYPTARWSEGRLVDLTGLNVADLASPSLCDLLVELNEFLDTKIVSNMWNKPDISFKNYITAMSKVGLFQPVTVNLTTYDAATEVFPTDTGWSEIIPVGVHPFEIGTYKFEGYEGKVTVSYNKFGNNIEFHLPIELQALENVGISLVWHAHVSHKTAGGCSVKR